MNLDDIQGVFFVECEESLEAAETGLDECAAQTHDDETINAIFRAVHSIKGGAGAFGHVRLQAFTHCFETLLADVREGDVELTPPLVDLMLHALDCLRDHVDAAREGGDPPADEELLAKLSAAQANGGEAESAEAPDPAASSQNAPSQSENGDTAPEDAPPEDTAAEESDSGDDLDLDALLDDLESDTGACEEPDAEADAEVGADTGADTGADSGSGPELTGLVAHIRPHASSMLNGSDPLLLLREMDRLGGQCTHCDVTLVPALEDFDPSQGYLGWSFVFPDEVTQDTISDIFDFSGDNIALAFGSEEAIPPARIEIADKPDPAEAGPAQSPEPAANPAPSNPTSANPTSASPDPAQAGAGDADTKSTAPQDAPAQKKTAPAKPAKAQKQGKAAGAKRGGQEGKSIRIDLDKLDRLIDGVGELVIAQAMLTQRLDAVESLHCEELTMLDGLIRDMQERAMAIRAQPVGSVFNRIPRLLRELAGTTGKHVKLEVVGEGTELDKTVIERLSEPLTHLIRNAVDHGIENAEERLAAGKPAEGTLLLHAEHRGGRILIRIEDDGRGINREKVLAKASEKGLVSEGEQLSDEEIDNLIFAPGFSTAQEVSNISGRGVGMDVVRQHVKELGGRITIQSNPGKGTAFILGLPLTLAISDGMIVKAGGQALVIPLAHVVESLRPNAEQIHGLGTDRQMLNVRDSFVPILPLTQLVNKKSSPADPTKGVLVIVETEHCGQAALLVDSINDQRQFVIKTLDTHYHSIEGVAGATILGDGNVSLIIDVDFLVQQAATKRSDRLAA